MNEKALSNTSLFSYGFLAAPIAFAGFPLYILAPDFYATQHGLSLATLGFILLALRAFDAVQDPIIGFMSDRFASNIFMVMVNCAALLVVSIFALFHPVAGFAATWFSVCMLIAVTAYSILAINLNSLGALWTSDNTEQTRISTSREALGLVGLLVAVILPNVLGNIVPKGQVFTYFSAILAVIMLLAVFSFSKWFNTYHTPTKHEKTEKQRIWRTLKKLPNSTLRLFLVYGLSVLASSIPAVLVIFFIRDRLDSEDQTGLFLLLYFLAGAAAMPLWKKLSVIYGKYQAWFFATLFACASFVWAFFLGAGDAWQFAVICIISGSALGADLALPPSILADHIHKHKSEASSATQYSILTLLTKAGLAVGSAIVLPLLDVSGFKPAETNSESALIALSIAYALIPCIIKLGSAYMLYRLFITQQKEMNNEIFMETRVCSGSTHHAK